MPILQIVAGFLWHLNEKKITNIINKKNNRIYTYIDTLFFFFIENANIEVINFKQF